MLPRWDFFDPPPPEKEVTIKTYVGLTLFVAGASLAAMCGKNNNAAAGWIGLMLTITGTICISLEKVIRAPRPRVRGPECKG